MDAEAETAQWNQEALAGADLLVQLVPMSRVSMSINLLTPYYDARHVAGTESKRLFSPISLRLPIWQVRAGKLAHDLLPGERKPIGAVLALPNLSSLATLPRALDVRGIVNLEATTGGYHRRPPCC